VPTLRVTESIIDSTSSGSAAITAQNTATDLQGSTIFGSCTLQSLDASNSIFTGIVTVTRRQIGCVRFSYVPGGSPGGSSTPRHYYCQPDLALKDVSDKTEQERIRRQIAPSFASEQYGVPGYAQLSLTCAEGIRTGGDDGAEMGAFHYLQQPQRLANLRASLDEYLRFGLEAGIFLVS
jgi:hypothetical protein